MDLEFDINNIFEEKNKKTMDLASYNMEEFFNELSKKRNEQNRYATMYPLYIVQEMTFEPANEVLEKTDFYKVYDFDKLEYINDEVYIPELNMEIKYDIIKYLTKKGITSHNFTIEMFDDIDGLNDYLKGYVDFIKIINVKKVYKDKAIFLLEEEAKRYMEEQSHNLRGARINVISPGIYNNSSLRKILEFLDKNNVPREY